ncbi:zinc finger protein 26-like [Sitodiplosis mosellana]|uniref:zinc finger protein 26-like n=1 Tax=Sitodiplosis mosellana TaxID=263140 RepID=UPI002443D885|nr:zinc finger protein 26-like [Sitodiplosis mosellana]
MMTDVNRFRSHYELFTIYKKVLSYQIYSLEIGNETRRNRNMESVFVTENPIDINLFVSECNDVPKLKVGEIFQLRDNSLSMCCVHCLQEFQYFTEFSLHIQDHQFLHSDVAQLREVKEGDSNRLAYADEISQLDTAYGYGQSNVKAETVREEGGGGNDSEFFGKDLELVEGWSDEDFVDNNQSIFEPEINVESFEKLPATPSFIEGTDYERLNGKYRCLTCNAHENAKWEHFKDHLLTHSNVRNIFCPICAKGFSAIAYVRKHVNRTHKTKITADKIREAQPSFNPSAISVSPVKTMETKSFVEGEDYEKSNGRFKCLTCDREMLDHIKEHLMTHSNDKNVFCPICHKRFITISYIRKHVNRFHKRRINAEQIKLAQSSFHILNKRKPSVHPSDVALAVVLSQNKLENVEKNFECFVCHRHFMSLSSLRIHLKLHSGIKFCCPHCDKLFAMKSYVRDHIVAMHNIRREEIPSDSIRQATGNVASEQRRLQPANAALFECNLCKNQYSNKQTLRQHMKTHTTASPFLCVSCGAVYKSIANLRYHMERHQADPNKRHMCNECKKTYPTRRYMLSHYRTIHLNKRKRKPKKDKASDNNEGQLANALL